jgi:hypothetical protein
MRKIGKIVIHCSDSAFGDVATIRRWHTDLPPRGNGWKDIGYHFVILNGFRKVRELDPAADGLIEPGRPVEQIGSHVKNHNKDSIGICLVGGRDPHGKSETDIWLTERQRVALFGLLDDLLSCYPDARIVGHLEFNPEKTCPNLNIDALRAEYAKWKENYHERIA